MCFLRSSVLLCSLLVVAALLASCGSSSSSSGSGSQTTTAFAGNWIITATETGTSGSVFTVTLVSSPCSVATPIGTFTVTGPTCFIADDNSGQGSISGSGSFFYPPQGVLLGAAVSPASNNSSIDLLFAEADSFGDAAVFSGLGAVSSNTITGSWSCNVNSPICLGRSGTFSGTRGSH